MSSTRHIYDYQPSPGSVGMIVPRMVDANARVLELGTGPGAITKQLHAKGCRVTGLEIDETAIPLVKPYCVRVIQADLNAPDWTAILEGELFDAIVMTDVLEHLYDPWRTLESTKALLAEGGAIIVSLPHVGHSAVMASLLNGRFDYQPWGLLDKTHLRFFGIGNVQELFDNTGLKIVNANFVVKEPVQTEFAAHWRQLSNDARRVLSARADGNIYQFVIKAVRITDSGTPLSLKNVALPPPAPGSFGQRSATGKLVSYISLKNRQRIADVLRRLGIQI